MVKSTIAILGATERTGAATAKKLASENFRLLLFGHDSIQLDALAREIRSLNPAAEIYCLDCLVDASWEADIIISALPKCSENEVAKKIREVATRKVLLVVANAEETGPNGCCSMPDPGEIETLLPDTKVVKTLSLQFAVDFVRAIAGGQPIDSLMTAYDSQAVKQ